MKGKRAANSRTSNRHMKLTLRRISSFLSMMCWLFVVSTTGLAQTKRLVILKLDGVPYDRVDRWVQQRGPRTGKSQLPWIDYVFYKRGTRIANFYVRGMSLSGPSWSLLNTGQHLQIKGNVEFDRFTLRSYDYLNFLPFFLTSANKTRVDMPAAEVLDSLGQPFLSDAYPLTERYLGYSLFQRGVRFMTLPNGLRNHFKKSPKEILDEWTTGLELRNTINDELSRELLASITNPALRYLEITLQDFDHTTHHNNDPASQLQSLK